MTHQRHHAKGEQRCYRCLVTGPDVYAALTSTGTRQPPLCSDCVKWLRHNGVRLAAREAAQVG